MITITCDRCEDVLKKIIRQ